MYLYNINIDSSTNPYYGIHDRFSQKYFSCLCVCVIYIIIIKYNLIPFNSFVFFTNIGNRNCIKIKHEIHYNLFYLYYVYIKNIISIIFFQVRYSLFKELSNIIMLKILQIIFYHR